jgi:hypothetical protein
MESVMRQWVFRFLSLVAGAIGGFAIGYAAMTLRVTAMSPTGLNLARTADPIARVFVEMARLEEAEKVLGSCKTTSNPSSQQALLGVESDLIGGLRTDAKVSGLAPPLDVAQAILGLRTNGALPKAAMGDGVREATTVNELLKRSGWPEDSERALREALAKMDGVCK